MIIEYLYQSEIFLLYAAIAAFITGIICALGGSGGLIITPFLIASGVPMHLAIGTAKFSSLGMWAVTIFKFNKADKIQWRRIPTLTIIAVIGGIIGTTLTLSINKEYIYPIVGVILIIVAPMGLLQKDFGLETISYGKIRNIFGYILIWQQFNGQFFMRHSEFAQTPQATYNY